MLLARQTFFFNKNQPKAPPSTHSVVTSEPKEESPSLAITSLLQDGSRGRGIVPVRRTSMHLSSFLSSFSGFACVFPLCFHVGYCGNRPRGELNVCECVCARCIHTGVSPFVRSVQLTHQFALVNKQVWVAHFPLVVFQSGLSLICLSCSFRLSWKLVFMRPNVYRPI